MVIETSKFVGKWRLVTSIDVIKNERRGRFMRVITKALDHVITPLLGKEISIEANGDHWMFTVARRSKARLLEFDVGTVSEEIVGGRKMTSSFHFDGAKVTIEAKKINPNHKNSTTELHLEDGKLVHIVTIESEVQSKRIYKRM